jgi:RNA polymerase sigma factor (sigma-70 family)
MQTSDNELLGKFVHDEDGGSFLELVQRHAPMVMGVCQSLLWQDEDAEDAFQATFLVLAKKAPRLLRHSSIAGWLHQVAVRNCRNLRRQKSRKREVELKQEPVVNANEPWKSISELHDRELVQQELGKLPRRYREALILCHIEGRSRAEAAEQLNCTTASVKAALARGRKLLKQRLIQHGIVASTVIGVLAAATQNAKANIPSELVASTAQFCQGQIPDTGFGSSSELIRLLANKELVGMNLTFVSKASACAALCVVLVGLPLALLAQAQENERATIELSDQESITPETSSLQIAKQESSPVASQDPANTQESPQIDSTDPLMEASKDSVEYWQLIRAANKARMESYEIQLKQRDSGDGSRSQAAIKADLLEARAKVLQVELLLEKLSKLNKPAVSKTARFIPPAPSENFQPGEVITMESVYDEVVNHRIVIASDYTISLPLIGIQSVKGLDQKQLRKVLEKRYAEYIKEPMIDIFRDLPARSGADIPLPATEPLQPGESISIECINDMTFNRQVIVQQDYSVTVPLLGNIQAKGLTPEAFAKKLTVASKQFINDGQIIVYRGGIDDPRTKVEHLK